MKKRTWLILLAAIPVVIAAGIVGAWAIDRNMHQGRAARNVSLAGLPVGGLERATVEQRVADISTAYAGQTAELRADGAVVSATNAELGFAVDQSATVEAVMAAGRDQSVAREFAGWVGSFVQPHQVTVSNRFDPDTARATLLNHPETQQVAPIEPDLKFARGNILLVPGIPGATFDLDGALAALEAADPSQPVLVEAGWIDIPTVVSDREVARAARRVQRATADGIQLQIADQTRWVPPEVARSWVRWTIDGDVELRVGQKAVDNHLQRAWRGETFGGSRPELTVADGQVEVVRPGAVPRECCAPLARRLVSKAVLGEGPSTIDLPLRRTTNQELVATARGRNVREVVGQFTTNHSCCEARVTNIHRIADLARGAMIYPGESLSLNQLVGQRTESKGFVPAGMVFYGQLVDSVGGGVSQFATTMFNAAYLAGLDFLEYQSHSLYFTRYPYGREATLSWPKPDLVLENNTGYPILVWTGYTDTSVTVQLWSTRNVQVEETGMEETSIRQCTRVERFRTRTFSDGRTDDDSVFAVYRPDEGLDCDGNEVEVPEGVEP